VELKERRGGGVVWGAETSKSVLLCQKGNKGTQKTPGKVII